jgi:hypothetical protein
MLHLLLQTFLLFKIELASAMKVSVGLSDNALKTKNLGGVLYSAPSVCRGNSLSP